MSNPNLTNVRAVGNPPSTDAANAPVIADRMRDMMTMLNARMTPQTLAADPATPPVPDGHTVYLTATGAWTLHLADATLYQGDRTTFVKTDANVNLITLAVKAASGQTINGAATYASLNAQFAKVTLESNGVNWIIVA